MQLALVVGAVFAFMPLFAFADASSDLKTIKSSAEYKRLVKDAKKIGGSFYCDRVEEKLTSKNYSSLPEIESKFSLVVVHCVMDPNDGGDPMKQAGLAVLDAGGVVSFTPAYVGQPD